MQKISIGFILFVALLLGVATNGYTQTAIVASPNPIPSTICNGTTINFVADNTSGTLTTFQWNFNGAAAGPQTVFTQTTLFTAGTTGTFTFDLIVGNGTTLDTTSFNIAINACTPPTIVISGTPTTVCVGTQVQFTDASTPGSVPIISRDWFFPGGLPLNSTLTNPLITYNAPGVYNVFYGVTDANGTYLDTLIGYINVVACPLPVADFLSNNQVICPGDPVNFTDLSQNVVAGQSTWSWSFPGADSAVSIQQNPSNIVYQIPGVYDVTLTVTNPNGLDTETKIAYITVDSCLPPEVFFTAESQKICKNTCVQFYNNSIREDSVLWHFSGVAPLYEWSKESNPIVCYSDTGKFDVLMTAYNDYGTPPSLKSEYISVKPFPVVQAPPNTSVLIGQSVELQAFGEGNEFRWTPDYNVDCEFCARTIVSPMENTKYFITNTNENGCSSTDSVNVIVIENYYRGVPDAFSPNGDEENDVLMVYGNGIEKMEFYVYERSGKLIFESRDITLGWDGYYQGQMMEAGVYIYFVKLTYVSGFQEILKGDVTLVR